MLNSKRRRLEDSPETASSTSNPRYISDPTTSHGVSGSKYQETHQLFGSKIHQLQTSKLIMDKFVSRLDALASSIQVVAFHVNPFSLFWQTNLQPFYLLAKAMEKKCNLNCCCYPHGVQLSPYDYPLDCLQTAIQDKDGPSHLLICKAILGKLEVVTPGSGLFQLSSEDLDSGVDNLLSPRKYIIWSRHLNTHFFPIVIVSFRASPYSEMVENCPTLSTKVDLRIFIDEMVTRLSNILLPRAMEPDNSTLQRLSRREDHCACIFKASKRSSKKQCVY
ncbi:hypothetical protein R3W88_011752 [Solanum pinnatisectum]|uniref:Uncharacterized protein n=1 Tax=Solanum pinnatisectum TaxID=50273 RepID=A0AAV9L9W0_9SOLN|nr:hypothetical protein R3W88_011752 [Solanum pinnatisectum]